MLYKKLPSKYDRLKFMSQHSNRNYKIISELILKDNFKEQMNYFTASVRRKIRKAKRNGIVAELGNIEHLDLFYQLYRKRIHQLGSIGIPKTYFKSLLHDQNSFWIKLILAMYHSDCIGVAILHIHPPYSENLYFATSKRHNYLYPSYALHAKMIELSIENHCLNYSFGRSTINSGVHCYKKQWGTNDLTVYEKQTWGNWSFRWLQKIAHPIIPMLPLSFVRILDHAVSKTRY